jgi:Ca2+-binding RTX toxin-like protein
MLRGPPRSPLFPSPPLVRAGDGVDRLSAAADGSADDFDGGAGRDVLDLSAAGRLTLDLAAGRASGARTGEDAVRRVETVIAGGGDDSLTGSDADEGLLGGGGDDRLDGRAGEDTLDGGAGRDALFGGDGHDLISGGAGADTLRGAAGADTLLGGDGADDVAGGAGDDLLDGGEGDDVLDGGAGDDVLRDGAGSDVVRGGDGEDRVVAALDAAADAYDGGAGEDTLDLSALARRGPLGAGRMLPLRDGDRLRQVWPRARSADHRSGTLSMFPTSDATASGRGVISVLRERAVGRNDGEQRLSDAVAVAGLLAYGSGRAAAVVLVLGDRAEDASFAAPAEVRAYLAALGVPLHVWGVAGGEPTVWGMARDVSILARLTSAVDDLRGELDRQRLVWLSGVALPQDVRFGGCACCQPASLR